MSRSPLKTTELAVCVVVAVVVAFALGAFRSNAGVSGWIVGIAAGLGVGVVARFIRGSREDKHRNLEERLVGSMSRQQVIRSLEWCLGVVLVAFALDGTRSAVNSLALIVGVLTLLALTAITFWERRR